MTHAAAGVERGEIGLSIPARVVAPAERMEIAREPDDDCLIEAALVAVADLIVFGDQDLLSLQSVGHIRIVTAHQFLAA